MRTTAGLRSVRTSRSTPGATFSSRIMSRCTSIRRPSRASHGSRTIGMSRHDARAIGAERRAHDPRLMLEGHAHRVSVAASGIWAVPSLLAVTTRVHVHAKPESSSRCMPLLASIEYHFRWDRSSCKDFAKAPRSRPWGQSAAARVSSSGGRGRSDNSRTPTRHTSSAPSSRLRVKPRRGVRLAEANRERIRRGAQRRTLCAGGCAYDARRSHLSARARLREAELRARCSPVSDARPQCLHRFQWSDRVRERQVAGFRVFETRI